MKIGRRKKEEPQIVVPPITGEGGDSFIDSTTEKEAEKHGFFEDIKNERETRFKEEQNAREAIWQEKQRIAKERANEKKSVFRKVGLVDKIATRRDDKEDAAKLEEFTAAAHARIAQNRAARQRERRRRNMPKYIIIGAVVITVLTLFSVINAHINNQKLPEQYDQAVEYILAGNYPAACRSLKDVDINDAKQLYSYSDTMSKLSSYKGNPDSVQKKFDGFGHFDNSEVYKQFQYADEQVDHAVTAQELCDAVDNEAVSLDYKPQLEEIDQAIAAVDENYLCLIDTAKYDLALQTVHHLEEGTAVGKTIEAIFAIGEVTLENGAAVENAQALYDALSDEDKKAVTNYALLKPAADKLDALKQEKAEQEAAEKKAQEEAAKKAEEERLAQEEAERQAEAERIAQEKAEEDAAQNRAAFYDATVYITPSGNCYHEYNCTTTDSRTVTAISRGDAISEGYVPCSRCNPDWGY